MSGEAMRAWVEFLALYYVGLMVVCGLALHTYVVVLWRRYRTAFLDTYAELSRVVRCCPGCKGTGLAGQGQAPGTRRSYSAPGQPCAWCHAARFQLQLVEKLAQNRE